MYNNKLLKLFLALMITASIAGCAAAIIGGAAAAGTAVAVSSDSRGAGVVVNDQQLEHDVSLALNKDFPKASFTVVSFGQRVSILGQVPTDSIKTKAETVALKVYGVKKVNNFLEVKKNETVSAITYDTYLTSLAKTRLIGQKGVNANNIKVVTCDKVVYLFGKDAGKKYQINGAIAAIKEIDGVKKVVDLID